MENMYTYILYDKEYDLFKIGRSSSPQQRFHKLCVIDKVYPVAIFPKDVELELHTLFKENRTAHPDETVDGYTEYFKRGGKFDEFITKIDEQKTVIPYCAVTDMVVDINKAKRFILADPLILWNIENDKFSYYKIGLLLLTSMGKIINNISVGIEVIDKVNIAYFKNKISITSELFHDIVDNTTIRVFDDPKAVKIFGGDPMEIKIDGDTLYVLITRK